MTGCTVPGCSAPVAPREERCAEHGGAPAVLHRHVTYQYRTEDGRQGSGAFARPVDDNWAADVVARVPGRVAHALRVEVLVCDCRTYRDAATRVIEREAVAPGASTYGCRCDYGESGMPPEVGGAGCPVHDAAERP